MDCWKKLGIEPTTHKRSIKIAYTEQLKLCRPDEDPEGFKQLRKAYEEALKESRFLTELNSTQKQSTDTAQEETTKPMDDTSAVADVETEEITSIETLEIALKQLYNDVNKRHLKEYWQALFNSPVSMNLDKSRAFEDCIVSFFCNNNLLPKEVLDAFVQHFKFKEEFVRFQSRTYFNLAQHLFYYLNSLSNRLPYPRPDSLPSDSKAHLRFLKARRMIEDSIIFRSIPADEVVEMYEDNVPEDQELRLFVARYCLGHGAYEQAIILLANKHRVEQAGGDAHALLAECLYRQERYGEALTHFQHHARSHKGEIPETTSKGIALCLAGMGEHEAAMELLLQLVEQRPHDFEIRQKLTEIQRRQIAQLRESKEDEKSLQLGQLLFDVGLYEECMAIIKPLKYYLENQSNPLLAKCYSKLGNYVEAGHEFWYIIQSARLRNENIVDLAAEYILFCERDLGPNQFRKIVGPEIDKLNEAARSNAEYAYIVAIIYTRMPKLLNVNAQQQADSKNKARYFINIATTLSPDNGYYHYMRGNLLYGVGDDKEVIKSYEIARPLNYADYLLNFKLGMAYFYTEQYHMAANRLEFTLGLETSTKDEHTLASKLIFCYVKLGNAEKAVEWLTKIRENEHTKPAFAYMPLCLLIDNCIQIPTAVPRFLLDLISSIENIRELEYKQYCDLFLFLLKHLDEKFDEEWAQLENDFNNLEKLFSQ